MKHFKNVLAMVLALVMVLSCVGMAFAAEKTETADLSNKTEITNISKNNIEGKKEEALKGFKSVDFQKNNAYQYADDEIVRAIVLLEGETEADAGEVGSEKAATQRVKLVNQHNAVFKAMTGINYELKYEYTRLLNGFSCDVAYGDLEAIAAIEGVEAVHIANSFESPVLSTPADTKQSVANEIVDNDLMHRSGWEGAGTVVAVLDTGLTLDHEAFQYIEGAVEEVVTEETIAAADLWVEGTYVSAKVPFAYDYAEIDGDVTDYNGHGTHVSGSAVGFAATVAEDGESYNITFSGAAPAAQLLSMKIFKDGPGGTSSDIYFFALEDAYALGADVINMSIGAQNGFTYDASLETEVFGNIYERLNNAGVILSIAAGNEYSMAANASVYNGYMNLIGPEYTDYGTVASPSTYEGNVSVASLENAAYPDFAIEIDGKNVPYVDSCTDEVHGWIQNFGGRAIPYQVILNAEGKISLGSPKDLAAYGDALKDKIVIVSRGELSFEEKVEFAANAGAAGCIVVNNDVGIISMSIETFEIPAISLQQSALEALSVTGTISTPTSTTLVDNPNAYLMSDFSNWGTSPMLTLDPTITGIGGMVYSSVPGGTDTYEVYSGTSMAAPNMTGMYAALLSAIYEVYPEMEKAEAAEMAKDLIYSSAIMIGDDDGYHYSPRKQGAGLGNAWEAIWNLKESGYISNPIQELGDDPEKTGVYEMSIELTNPSEFTLSYGQFETYVLYDKLASDGKGTIVNSLSSDYAYLKNDAETDEYGRGASVTYSVDGTEITELVLGAGETVTIDVTITLTEEQMAFFDKYYPNGAFVEGYVVFNEIFSEKIWSTNHATFLAYYGDWTQANVLEEATSEDVIEATNFLATTVANAAGDTYADLGYTWANTGLFNFYTNPNMAFLTDSAVTKAYAYAGDSMLGIADYYPEHAAFSTPLSNGTYNYAELIYMEPYLLRNARHLIMTVTDKETGEIYYVDDTQYLPKAIYDSDYTMWRPTGSFAWDGTNAEGEYVPSGTVATISFDAVLPYGEALQEDVWTYDITVDYTAPVLEEIVLDAEAGTLTVTASDENYLQGIYLADMYYEILDTAIISSDKKGEAFTVTFDISELAKTNAEIIVTAIDYATNEMETSVYLFETGKPATITLNTPDGTETFELLTGDQFIFPEGPSYEMGDFLVWVSERVDYVTGDDVFDVGGDWYFADDKIVVTEDITVYALYQSGTLVEYAQPNYYYTKDSNYNGDYALIGWNYDYDEDRYVIEDPIALNNKLEEIAIADIENSSIGDHYIEFYTSEPSIAFTLASDEKGAYTIQSSDGKYMALLNGELVMLDEVMDEAKWIVYADPNPEVNSTKIYNAVDENKILLYNDDTEAFEIMDDAQPIAAILEMYGVEVYPSEFYQLLTYKKDTHFFLEESVFYTTELELECAHLETEIRDAAEPTCTEEGYTGDTYCTVCGEKVAEGEAIAANGHSYEEGICTVCGAEDPDFNKPCYFNDFSDCEAAWYHEAVDFAVANGLMNGMSSSEFGPNTALSRAMVVTVLYRAAGEPEVTEPSTFTDVAEGIWYSDAIAWAQDNGIVNGVTTTKFAPDQDVTREQIATILWRYAGSPEATADLSSFRDADTVSGYAAGAINWAVAEGIMNGDGKNLNPLKSATRAEFACMIMRYLEGSYVCNE